MGKELIDPIIRNNLYRSVKIRGLLLVRESGSTRQIFLSDLGVRVHTLTPHMLEPSQRDFMQWFVSIHVSASSTTSVHNPKHLVFGLYTRVLLSSRFKLHLTLIVWHIL